MRGGQSFSYFPVQKTLQISLRAGDIVANKAVDTRSFALAVEEIQIAGKRFAMSSQAETFQAGCHGIPHQQGAVEERCPYDG
jgi:flagellar basal body P-ring protein FlgI